MSSSTSSSEPVIAGRAEWRRFVLVALASAVGAAALVMAAAIALDPYDTGRFGLWSSQGVRQQGPRTANASRGRDPRFESAVIGNSHVQLLSPERLSAQTGQPFVSLIAPGTRPPEQLAVLAWFVSRPRPKLSSVVMGIDATWCTGDPALPLEHEFPFWLYSGSNLEYLRGLIRIQTVEELGTRIRTLAMPSARKAVRDGFWDYEPNYLALGYGSDPAIRQRLEAVGSPMPRNVELRFPAADRLADAMARLPADLRLVLIHPPSYAAGLSQPASEDARVDAACKAAFARLAAQRPNTVVVDWRRDGPHARDASLWFDKTHYRRPLAETIEASIAAALK